MGDLGKYRRDLLRIKTTYNSLNKQVYVQPNVSIESYRALIG